MCRSKVYVGTGGLVPAKAVRRWVQAFTVKRIARLLSGRTWTNWQHCGSAFCFARSIWPLFACHSPFRHSASQIIRALHPAKRFWAGFATRHHLLRLIGSKSNLRASLCGNRLHRETEIQDVEHHTQPSTTRHTPESSYPSLLRKCEPKAFPARSGPDHSQG